MVQVHLMWKAMLPASQRTHDTLHQHSIRQALSSPSKDSSIGWFFSDKKTIANKIHSIESLVKLSVWKYFLNRFQHQSLHPLSSMSMESIDSCGAFFKKIFKIITSLSPWNRPTSRAPNLPFARPCAGDKWEICLEQSKLVKKDLLTTPRVAPRIWQAKKNNRKSYKNLMLEFPKSWQNFGESTMSTINKTFRGLRFWDCSFDSLLRIPRDKPTECQQKPETFKAADQDKVGAQLGGSKKRSKGLCCPSCQ